MKSVETLPALVDAEDRLVQRGRFMTATFLLGNGDDEHLVRVVDGRVVEVRRGPFVGPSWDFALRASSAAWAAHWAPVPAPGAHDLLAMVKRGELRLEGNLHPFMANLLYMKDLLGLLRAERA